MVIGPAAGSRVTMLRVYAYGGLIGQIATRRADFSHLAEAENDEKGKKEERADLAEKGKNDKGKDYAYWLWKAAQSVGSLLNMYKPRILAPDSCGTGTQSQHLAGTHRKVRGSRLSSAT